MDDLISRQAALEKVRAMQTYKLLMGDDMILVDKADVQTELMMLPSVQPNKNDQEEFIKLTARYSDGRPYYSIIYLKYDKNGVGHDFEGYSSYSLDVISDYLKKYFMPSAQPETLTDKEQRIFLAAMGREEKVCRQVDDECGDCRDSDSLVRTCHEITRKVKGTLWT